MRLHTTCSGNILGEAEFWGRCPSVLCGWEPPQKSEFYLASLTEHPAIENMYAIGLLASPGAIPHVFNAGVNSAHVGER